MTEASVVSLTRRQHIGTHFQEQLEYAYTLECEATDCLVPISDQVIALEDPADVQEIMSGVVSGSSEAGLQDRLKVRYAWS